MDSPLVAVAFVVVLLLFVAAITLLLWWTSAATTIASVAVSQEQSIHLDAEIPPGGATLRLEQQYTGRRSGSRRGILFQAAIELTVENDGKVERHFVSIGTAPPIPGAVDRSGLTTRGGRVIVRDDGRGNGTSQSIELLQVRLAPGRARIAGRLLVTEGKFDAGRLLVVV